MENNIDVLDNNYPLLLKLKEGAPGTFSHSKNVASLLETIGVGLKLDIELLRICGYYHDLGKQLFPKLYIENQEESDNNPHTELEPNISYKIIHSHIGDTVQILINDPNIPRKAIEIISQHHGQTIMKSFYRKSKLKNPDNYRYKTTKPQSIESALLMITDQLEATSKFLSQTGKLNDINGLVENVINELINDEQLDNVEFTFGKFREIKKILKNELTANFHKRVDYDEAIDEEDEKEGKSRKSRKSRKRRKPREDKDVKVLS